MSFSSSFSHRPMLPETEPPSWRAAPSRPGGAAQQMGQHGGEKNQRCGAEGHGAVFPHCHKDRVGGAALRHTGPAVEKDNGQTAQGKQEENPGVCAAQCGDPVNGEPKGHAQRPHDKTNQNRKQHPAAKCRAVVPDFLPIHPCIPAQSSETRHARTAKLLLGLTRRPMERRTADAAYCSIKHGRRRIHFDDFSAEREKAPLFR